MRASLIAILALACAGPALSAELLDAGVSAGAEATLQSGSGSVRLERARLNATAHPTLVVPEPGNLASLGTGIWALTLIHTRRRRRALAGAAGHASGGRKGITRASLGIVASVVLVLAATPSLGEVPANTTFSGRLVDGAGTPLASPVAFDLWLYDDESAGTALYAERHSGVVLDAEGNFSVLLGTGTDFGAPAPPFDPDLFSGVDRFVEVVLIAPIFELLAPRVAVSSVPWALVAQQANAIVPDPSAPRFEDCGDGTVADRSTGLQWEKKTAGVIVGCGGTGCPDPHGVGNRYTWSSSGVEPDGTVFTNFLARLNGEFDPANPTGCFAGWCDWQLPKISQLQTILIGIDAAPGQATTCGANPCIDPLFAAVGGPTQSQDGYWSTTDVAGFPTGAWVGYFAGVGDVGGLVKTVGIYARAVRTGSCP